jgi:signal transduction histidine kinase
MPGLCLRRLTALLIAVVLGQAWLGAQEASVEITTVKDVLALSPDAAAQGTIRVRLHGIILDVVPEKRNDLSLHDGTGAISVSLKGVTAPDVGTEVTIEGIVTSETFADRPRPRIEATTMATHGTGKLPQPAKSSVPDAKAFKHLDQWITVEGVVLQVMLSTTVLTIQLGTQDDYCNVIVRNWPTGNLPKDWVGGTVRVSGVNRPYSHMNPNLYGVMTPSPEQVVVVKPGVVDPYDAPVTTVAALLKSGGPTSKRYKIPATVLNSTGGNVTYLRDKQGDGFSIYQIFPLSLDTSGRTATPVEKQRMFSPGDVVEVVGTPSFTDPGLHLGFAMVRFIEPGPPPEPVPTDISSLASGKAVNNFVELHGRLVALDDVMVTNSRFRTTLRIEDSKQTILAFLDSPKRGALSDLRPDHLLKLRAIVSGSPHFPEIRLWLPSPRDVQSLGVASDVIARRVWTWVGITSACIVPLLVYVLMLRRSRAAVGELNENLEKHVLERTAELAAAKDDLSKALSQERDLSELKTRFITMVSHEFRTPLGITMSAVELIRHYSNRLSAEKLAELHDDIHASTLRMSGLMEQVLVLGRVEAGKTAFHPTPVNVVELCSKITDEGLSATSHRCPVHFSADGDFTGAEADEGLMRHIFSNLLSNAVKYSPEGAQVEFKVHRDNGHAVFTVQDHGIGIPEADMSRLFEAFHRATNVGDIQGTGLGLLLVKRCVDLHLGTIDVDSKEGKGTTIKVRLPVEDASK